MPRRKCRAPPKIPRRPEGLTHGKRSTEAPRRAPVYRTASEMEKPDAPARLNLKATRVPPS